MAQHRRRLPSLKRVVAYITPEEYAYLMRVAQRTGWSLSRYISGCIEEARQADERMMLETEQERMVMEGLL